LASRTARVLDERFDTVDDVRRQNSFGSLWSPFRHRPYAIIWTVTLVSNIGGWMYQLRATDPVLQHCDAWPPRAP